MICILYQVVGGAVKWSSSSTINFPIESGFLLDLDLNAKNTPLHLKLKQKDYINIYYKTIIL